MYGDYDDYDDWIPRRGRPPVPKFFTDFKDDDATNVSAWKVLLSALRSDDAPSAYKAYLASRGTLSVHGSKKDGAPPRRNVLNKSLAKLDSSFFRSALALSDFRSRVDVSSKTQDNGSLSLVDFPSFVNIVWLPFAARPLLLPSLVREDSKARADEMARRGYCSSLPFMMGRVWNGPASLRGPYADFVSLFDDLDADAKRLEEGRKIEPWERPAKDWTPPQAVRESLHEAIVETILCVCRERAVVSEKEAVKRANGEIVWERGELPDLSWHGTRFKPRRDAGPETEALSVALTRMVEDAASSSDPDAAMRTVLLGLHPHETLSSSALRHWFSLGMETLPLRAHDPAPLSLVLSDAVPDKALSVWLAGPGVTDSFCAYVSESKGLSFAPPAWDYRSLSESRAPYDASASGVFRAVDAALAKGRHGAALSAVRAGASPSPDLESLFSALDFVAANKSKSRPGASKPLLLSPLAEAARLAEASRAVAPRPRRKI